MKSGLRIAKEPRSVVVDKKGDSATLSVKATAYEGEPISYQWYKYGKDGEEPVEGANKASLTVTVQSKETYYCAVSDQYGKTVYTDDATVSIYSGLDVRNNGTSVKMYPGKARTLKVDAVSEAGSITYKWYKRVDTDSELELIATATGASLTIQGTNEDVNVEYYRCVVSDGINSENVDFSPFWGSSIRLDYEDEVTVDPGASCKLTMNAVSQNGGSDFTYTWYYNGYELIDAEVAQSQGFEGYNTKTLTIKSVKEATSFECQVTDNASGETKWANIDVAVENGFDIDYEDEVTLTQGKTAKLEVKATAKDATGIKYYWEDNYDEEIPGVVTGTLEVSEPGSYSCMVTDKYGNRLWANIDVTMDSGFKVENEAETNVYVDPGKPVTLKINASTNQGNELEYRWDADDASAPSDSDTLTFTPKRSCYVECYVTDGYNGRWVEFYVIVNGGLVAMADGDDSFTVKQGDSVTCKVKTEGGRVSTKEYHWYLEDGREIKSAAGKSTCTYAPKKSGEIQCEVTCGEETDSVWFDISVESGLTLSYPEKIVAQPGEDLTLEVKATGSNTGRLVTYNWYDDYGDVDAEYESTLKINAKYSNKYWCDVSDGITEKTAEISVIVVSADDQAAAEVVKKSIDSLGSITLSKESAVKEARAAYDALTDDQKELIPADTLKKLTDAEKAIEKLQKQVQDVVNQIKALPQPATAAAADAVKAARAAYDALAADQKSKVPADVLKKLTDAEAATAGGSGGTDPGQTEPGQTDQAAADKAAADAAANQINALPEVITAADAAAVAAARAAYDGLTDAQKALVPADTLNKLAGAEAVITQITKAKAKKVKLVSVKNKKSKKAVVKWKKLSGVNGYQVQYSTNKKFKKKGLKKKNIKKAKIKTVTLKKLKKGKTYYVRVCSFTKVKNPANGKITVVYGKWSKAKKVKIKK